MKGLIISSGKINDYTLLEDLIEENDYIVCADGGLNHLMNINKAPHVILGDLDSVSDLGIKYIKDNNIKVEKYPSIKDNTDSELAIIYLINKGIDDMILIGGTGTRLDHTLANLFLLKRFNKNGKHLKVIDDNNIVTYVVDTIEIAINYEGIIVSLTGFKYPLDNKYIEFSSTLGISNEIIEDIGIIEIHKGEALVFESLD